MERSNKQIIVGEQVPEAARALSPISSPVKGHSLPRVRQKARSELAGIQGVGAAQARDSLPNQRHWQPFLVEPVR